MNDIDRPGRAARMTTVAIIVAVSVASVAYRLLFTRGLDQSAALFVGVPSLLAIMVTLFVSPGTAYGTAVKAVSIGLLLSLVLLWEGALCVAMSAPLFYLVAIAVTSVIERLRRGIQRTSLYCAAIVVVALPPSLEGVTPGTTIDRAAAVTVSRTVAARPADVERAVLLAPRLDRPLPFALRLGFPRPVATRLETVDGQVHLVVTMRGGEMRLNGMEPRTGDLRMALVEHGAGYARWRQVSDTTHMTHFLTWRQAVVRWEADGPESTRITWTIEYDRGLDPAWYFGPLERVAVRLAAGYLITASATP